MIHPSLFLRRAIQADALISGTMALLLTFGAGPLSPLLNLPEALLRETGLFLIGYAALVGWLGSRPSMPPGTSFPAWPKTISSSSMRAFHKRWSISALRKSLSI